MTKTTTYQIRRAKLIDICHEIEGIEAAKLLDLDSEILNALSCRNRDLVEFQLVEVTLTIEKKPKYRHGFSGQMVEQVVDRQEKIIESESKVLRKYRGKFSWLD